MCEGHGLVRTTESAALVALRKIHNRIAQGDVGSTKVSLPPEVALYLLNTKREDLALLERRLSPRPRVIRFGVVHAEAPETAERVRTALMAAYRPRDCLVSLATGVLGTHVGIGAWGIFYQVEDGTPEVRGHDAGAGPG